MHFNRVSRSGQSLSFFILGQRVRVDCSDPVLRQLLVANFGTMAAAPENAAPDLLYSVSSGDTPQSFSLIRQGRSSLDAEDIGDLLFLLEKDMTLELQKRRSDLLFLHSAAVEWQGKACLLAAESGSGKSTTTWALLHHQFRYLTDELSPIDLHSMQVFPYSHALCLKQPPPAYPLPAGAIHLRRTIHIPTRFLPSAVVSRPRPLGAVFIVKYCPDVSTPSVQAIGPAEASARLYVTTLNALAHSNHGLDAVVRIAEHVPCFTVSSNELPATCALIRSTIEDVARTVETRV
jgi:hypothetical protein